MTLVIVFAGVLGYALIYSALTELQVPPGLGTLAVLSPPHVAVASDFPKPKPTTRPTGRSGRTP